MLLPKASMRVFSASLYRGQNFSASAGVMPVSAVRKAMRSLRILSIHLLPPCGRCAAARVAMASSETAARARFLIICLIC